MSIRTPRTIAEKAAREAVTTLTSKLIELMLDADEDPTDDALWKKRKAEALVALRADLDHATLGPAGWASVPRG